MDLTDRRLGLALAGERGTLHYEPRLFISNVRGEELREVPGILSATADLSNFRDNTWGLALEAKNTDAFNPNTDYVLAAMDFKAGKDKWTRFPLGLYRFFLPGGEDSPEGSTWALEGESLEFLLLRAMASGGYRVPPGTGVLAAVRGILNMFGVPDSQINFPKVDKTITNGMYFDPVKDNEGAYYIRICNSLLGMGGFGAIQTTATGQFITAKTISIGKKVPTVFYGRAEDGADDMLIAQSIARGANYDRFANEVFVSSQDVNQEPGFSSIARNTNPNSPVSIQNLGYTVTKTVQMETAADQESVDLMAQAELASSNAYQMVRDISTMPDYRRHEDEAYKAEAYNVEGERVMDGKWIAVSWSLDLSQEPGVMTHQLSRTEDFDG